MKRLIETDKEFLCDVQAPCFQFLSKEEMALIQQSKTQIIFKKGENLTKQGAFATYILFIVSGIVKQQVEADGDKSIGIKIYTPGEFIGLSSVFTKSIFPFSSIALTEVHAILVEKQAMSEVMQNNGAFSYQIIRQHCENNIGLYETITQLHFRQMNGRMAEFLLKIKEIEDRGFDVLEHLSRKDIASFAAMTMENAVKILKGFEKDSIINLSGKPWLLDEKKMEEIRSRG